MNKPLAFLLGFALFIFIAPVCIFAGACGGCLFAAFASTINDTAAGLAMGAGVLVGLAAGIVIPILVVRSIRASSRS